MEDRTSKGYTVIQFAALGNFYGRNTNGDEPFIDRNLSQPGDYIKVWVMSPRTGTVKYVGIFENHGTHTITMPTLEGPRQDWILLIDDAGVNFRVPGAS